MKIHNNPPSPFRLLRFAPLLLATALTLPLRAQTQPASTSPDAGLDAAPEQLQQQPKAAKHPASDNWFFSLLPVGLQKNPRVDYAIVTEMTDAGRKLAEPSVDKPVYYIAHSVNQKDLGDAYGGTKDIPCEYLQKQLATALASNGYRPADPEHPDPGKIPTQVLFFSWGMHNMVELPAGATRDDLLQYLKNILSRARTVGGQKFADAFAYHRASKFPLIMFYYRMIDEIAAKENPNAPKIVDMVARGSRHGYTDGDDTTETLFYETYNDCYYLIVTSYDLESLKSHQKKLLWVTRISTIARGVNFEQTLPIMIDNGAYFFGRETTPEILQKRAYKKATVDIGDPTVVEYMTGTTAATGTSAPAREKGKEKENN